MNHQTKYWAFTWEPNCKRKKIPKEGELIDFLNEIGTEGVFQLERGVEKGKLHYQGVITLEGPRISKTTLLNTFKTRFKNDFGLTISPVSNRVAIDKYCTKEETRVSGPYYVGKNQNYDEIMANAKLKKWQQKLYNLLLSDELTLLKDRKVVWVHDQKGNTGKSWFQKWLRMGQRKLVVRSLPVASVDRLSSAVNIITKKLEVDVFTIDLTRTRGEDQSFKDLFSMVEMIKNGAVVDVMYGKYNEAYFKPPAVVIFSNEYVHEYLKYLSKDRWEVYEITSASSDLLKIDVYKDPIAQLLELNEENEKKRPLIPTKNLRA
jgi:hypothetical protein